MISVKVVYKSSGKPASGVRVSVSFDGLTRGITGNEYTNSSGEAHFDANPGSGTVFADGKSVYKGNVSGRVVVYI